MEGIFLEFENENALRSYPFAAGCVPPEQGSDAEIPPGVFVDAALYPVNPSGTLYLSSISEDGTYSISDERGVVMSGAASGAAVELYDASDFSRHVGTLVAASEEVLSEFSGRGVLREYSSSETTFAASCVFPVVVDGVSSVSVADSGKVAGHIEFSNMDSDDIRVSSGIAADGRKTLRFDVLPRIADPGGASIRRIICVVDGRTPFRISRAQGLYNTVILTLDAIDRDTVCSSAHRENSFEMADTCSCNGPCKPDMPSKEGIPYAYQIVEVFIPPDADGSHGGVRDGADNAFYLAVPNLVGYVNPLSITLEDGAISPKTTEPEVVIDGNNADLAEGEMLDKVLSKGIAIQVPGLSGGMS
jgi:hypothetical protein